jgi:hypothetical protein
MAVVEVVAHLQEGIQKKEDNSMREGMTEERTKRCKRRHRKALNHVNQSCLPEKELSQGRSCPLLADPTAIIIDLPNLDWYTSAINYRLNDHHTR